MYQAYDEDGNYLGSFESFEEADNEAGDDGYVTEDESRDYSTFDYDYMV